MNPQDEKKIDEKLDELLISCIDKIQDDIDRL